MAFISSGYNPKKPMEGRITDIGPRHFTDFLPPVLAKNKGAWDYHEIIEPGMLLHVGSAAAPTLGVLGEPDALSTAEGALAVRVLATQLDDFALGAAGRPATEAYRPGALGTDITTLAAIALAAMGGARTGSMNVRPVGEAVTVAPDGLRSLGARIPSAVAGGPQLRIERYGPVEAPRWIVYSTGTVDFGMNGTTVFDLRADVAAIADRTAASTVAADRAMRDAGVGPADPVLLVGHSQGGLVVQQLAESDLWNIDGVLTFGAPAAPHLGEVPVVAIEHSEDVVPAIVGFQPSHDGEAYANYRVDAMDGGTPVPDHVMPAHSMSMYEQSADRVEATGDAGVRAFLDELHRIAPADAGGAATWYLAQRPQVVEPGQTLIAPGRTSAADAGGVR